MKPSPSQRIRLQFHHTLLNTSDHVWYRDFRQSSCRAQWQVGFTFHKFLLESYLHAPEPPPQPYQRLLRRPMCRHTRSLRALPRRDKPIMGLPRPMHQRTRSRMRRRTTSPMLRHRPRLLHRLMSRCRPRPARRTVIRFISSRVRVQQCCSSIPKGLRREIHGRPAT